MGNLLPKLVELKVSADRVSVFTILAGVTGSGALLICLYSWLNSGPAPAPELKAELRPVLNDLCAVICVIAEFLRDRAPPAAAAVAPPVEAAVVIPVEIANYICAVSSRYTEAELSHFFAPHMALYRNHIQRVSGARLIVHDGRLAIIVSTDDVMDVFSMVDVALGVADREWGDFFFAVFDDDGEVLATNIGD